MSTDIFTSKDPVSPTRLQDYLPVDFDYFLSGKLTSLDPFPNNKTLPGDLDDNGFFIQTTPAFGIQFAFHERSKIYDHPHDNIDLNEELGPEPKVNPTHYQFKFGQITSKNKQGVYDKICKHIDDFQPGENFTETDLCKAVAQTIPSIEYDSCLLTNILYLFMMFIACTLCPNCPYPNWEGRCHLNNWNCPFGFCTPMQKFWSIQHGVTFTIIDLLKGVQMEHQNCWGKHMLLGDKDKRKKIGYHPTSHNWTLFDSHGSR